ncbi:phage DNA polymerase-associated SH3 family protein [Paraburkholderia sp. BCC1886]|uniref:phage DNA polymerase-associated SH3 family protein n=1 Tax=Paraburkholderia sp. BCC1886 TaxID=2562670 RepID=UPI001181E08D|nr:phage DNA polymerase-associated SH3 family protein [Paraburkholderia sp. BCC1886]
MSYNYQIGQVLSFSLYPTAVLGNSLDNVTVLGTLDQDSANAIIDTVGMYLKVAPYLPSPVPTGADQYNYIKVKTSQGVITALGMPWINESTIVATTNQTITATISGVTASDVTGVQNALISNGYTNISVSINSTTASSS